MNYQELLEKLQALVNSADVARLTDHELIEGFQETHGLEVDGILGPVTARYIEAPRMCGVKDRLSNSKCRWDHTKWDGTKFVGTPEPMLLKYFVDGKANKLSKAETDNAVAEALSSFPKVCAVQVVPLAGPTGANLVVKFGAIDGDSGTLAWCELPCGKDTPATQLNALVDNEPWVVAINPAQGRLDIVRVLRHEFGHWLGLDHLADGNLLAPYYSETVRDLQPGDIKELVLRYGPPIPVAVPPTSPPPPPPTTNLSGTTTVRLSDGRVLYGELALSTD